MYNPERKEAFIAERIKNARSAYYVRKVFNKFGKYEDTEWHEDVCLQPRETIEPIINAETGTKITSAERTLVVLRDYIDWCNNNGIRTSNGVYQVKVDTVQATRMQMVSSPEHLLGKLNKVFGDPMDETIACVYKSFYWLAFAGIEDVEAIQVTVDEIDLSDLIVRHNEKIYQLYTEAKRTFEQSCTLEQFKYEHTKYESYKPRVNGNELMRGTNGMMSISNVRTITTRKSTQVNEKLSYKKIYYSGIFYRAHQKENRGGVVDFKHDVADIMQGHQYQYGRNHTKTQVINRIRRELELDYEKWKCAFNL